MKHLLMNLTLSIGLIVPAVQASAGHRVWDRVEDRIDRAENRADERVTYGPRDRIEDVIDRWEDRRDRLNLPRPRWINVHERRSWRRRWGH